MRHGFGRAIAMMYVKVDDGDSVEAAHVERMLGGDGDIVEQAETHGLAGPRMVARRSDRAKGVADLAIDNGVRGSHGRASGGQGRLVAVRVEQGVAVERIVVALGRHIVAHQADGRGTVVALDVRQLRAHAIAVLDQVADMREDQLIVDGLQAGRRFRMPVAHFMALAIGMGINGCAHALYWLPLSLLSIHTGNAHRNHCRAFLPAWRVLA